MSTPSSMPEVPGRRPLKTRSTRWARGLAAALAASGIPPNAISLASVGFAAAGFLCFWEIGFSCVGLIPSGWLWLGAGACIQLRLLCNLMDGMVAIEGGKKSRTGDLWNEIPDRFADVLFLTGAGIAAGVPWPGVVCAFGALLTAYLRAFGASLTGVQDFCGPFAKPQRMALLTAACGVSALEFLWGGDGQCMLAALAIMLPGIFLTCWRRSVRLARSLNRTTEESPG